MSRKILLNPALTMIIIVAAASLSLGGCASAFDTRPISQKYADKLVQLEPGMSIEQFRKIIPEAHPRGQNIVDGIKIDAYELVWRHTRYMMGDRHYEYLWFYFSNKKLVKWGEPNDWPSKADLTIEFRDR